MQAYGLPPEIIGLNALSGNELDYVKDIYKNFDIDLSDSLQYLNEENLKIFPNEIVKNINKIKKMADYQVEPKHNKITSIILQDLKRKDHRLLAENITRAGFVRGFLG